MGAFHEPQSAAGVLPADVPERSTAGKMLATPWRCRRLSTPFHKYNHVCGEGFLAQTRRERRAYPAAVCKERATTCGTKRTAARRVASLFGSGFVAPRSQPHFGGCSLVAPRQNRKSTQQTWSYLWNGVL